MAVVVRPVNCMRTLAYALAASLLVLSAPVATAEECPLNICPEDVLEEVCGKIPAWPHCTVFSYGLNPPGYRINPNCLFPLPP